MLFWRLGGLGGAAPDGLFGGLEYEDAAVASRAGVRGARDVTASRANSLLLMTEMMSLMGLEAMDASLRTS